MLIFYYQFRFGFDSRFSIRFCDLKNYFRLAVHPTLSTLCFSPLSPTLLPLSFVVKFIFDLTLCTIFAWIVKFSASPTLRPYTICAICQAEMGGGDGIMRRVLPEICARDNASKSLSRALAWAICRVARKGQQRAAKKIKTK